MSGKETSRRLLKSILVDLEIALKLINDHFKIAGKSHSLYVAEADLLDAKGKVEKLLEVGKKKKTRKIP